MMKKTLSFLLCCVLVLACFTACSNRGGKPQTTAKNEVQTTLESKIDTSSFRISYTKSDSLNPFKARTLNNQVVQNLVYEGLFYVDESFEAQPQLAERYSYPDNKTVSVVLKSGVKFSDGTVLNAAHVVSSFKQAKDSPHWRNALSNFKSATAESDRVIVFKLKSPNPNAHKLLTFAVAKAKDNDDGFRAGTGRYMMTNAEGAVVLTVNENKTGFSPNIVKIHLVNITSAESIINAINIGNISYAYRDLSEGSKAKIKTSQKTVNLNNLVYLGIYGKGGITANLNIRRAINYALDRDAIVKGAYRGYGKSATSIYNPASALAKETVMFSTTADVAAAKQAIVAAKLGKDKKLSLTLVCSNKEGSRAAAQLVKQQLGAAGFKVTVEVKKGNAYQSAVQNGHFDLYIGETKIPADLGLQSFFEADGATSYGIDFEKEEAAASYNEYLEGKSEIGKFMIDYSQELPFLPLLYRQGMLCYTKSLKGDIQGYDGNFFSNIEEWYYN